MSRTETANSLTVFGVNKRIESWSDQIEKTQARETRLAEMQSDLTARMEAFELTKSASVDQMARALMPLATAMTRLIEETRQTLEVIGQDSREAQQQARASTRAASDEAARVLRELQASGLKLEARIQGYLDTARDQPPPPNPWIPAVVSPLILLGLILVAHHFGLL